ncbi:MAG: SAM-dependent methyltransferase [Pseudonocardiaceae bacterium]
MCDCAPSAPLAVDVTRPNAARIYDWYLGGGANYAIDREFGKKVADLWPHVKGVARQNRGFLRRAVINALDAGVRQFLDLGSGVPTVGNVHAIARHHLPAGEQVKVVYVDYEHVAAAHAQVLLENEKATDWAGVLQADMRDPGTVLDHDVTDTLLDRREPICVLMIAVLPFVGGNDNVPDLLTEYTRRLAPGSWLALTHIASDEASAEDQMAVEAFRKAYDNTSNPLWVRDYDEMSGWFRGLHGWSLFDPGVVHLADWRPERDSSPEQGSSPEQEQLRPFAWCGAAEKLF